MALENIITIVIIALIVVFAWGIFRRLFKLLFYVGLIIILLIAANAFFIYKDIADLRENFAVSTKKVILVDEDEVLTGFLLNDEVNFLTGNELEEFSSFLKSNNYEKISGDSYRLMVFELDIIEKLDAEIEIGDKFITNNYAISVLKSGEPFIMLKDKNIDENGLGITKKDLDDNSRVKAALFGIILTNHILSPKNPLFFFSELKKGNIIIYPETALFRTAKVIPLTFIKNTGKKLFEKTKAKAKTFVVEAVE